MERARILFLRSLDEITRLVLPKSKQDVTEKTIWDSRDNAQIEGKEEINLMTHDKRYY